jgi:A/G-specific adenine glycosylase
MLPRTASESPPPAAVARAVVDHFRAIQRDLPWRRTKDAYAIWVSEIMLQQTRVAAVVPYYERWLARFPTVSDLAAAPLDDVLTLWAGLGYYSRARNLHRGAQEVVARYDGALPRLPAELVGLPGIGRYTAGAIASIAHGVRTPLVDGNVVRVLARVYAVEGNAKAGPALARLWTLAGAIVDGLADDDAPGDLNQGLMELGATVCTPRAPGCLVCPLRALCRARAEGREEALPELPARKKADELPLLATTALWLEEDGAVLVARRRAEGLFGGLWELPQGDDAADATRVAGALLGRAVAIVDGAVVMRHQQVLSHRRLAIEVVRAQAGAPQRGLGKAAPTGYDRTSWLRLADVSRPGISAATAAILDSHRENPGWNSIPKRSASSPRVSRRSSKASAGSATTSATRTSPRPRRGPRKASTSSSTTRRR